MEKLKRFISDRSKNREDEEEHLPKLHGLLSKFEENLDEDLPKLEALLSKFEENLDGMQNRTVKVEPMDPFQA